MGVDVFLTAFLFPFIAFAFLGYLVVKYKQNPKPFFYILIIFASINIVHFKYGMGSVDAAVIWLMAINAEALIVFIFAMFGYKRLRAASK